MSTALAVLPEQVCLMHASGQNKLSGGSLLSQPEAEVQIKTNSKAGLLWWYIP